MNIRKEKYFLFFILLFFSQIIHSDNGNYDLYIEKLPVHVTDVAEEDKLELYIKVPDGFCHNSLVKRINGGFHKKEYIPCKDLRSRKAEKIFYIYYNEGKFPGSTEDLINTDIGKLSKFCSSNRIFNHQNKKFDNHTQSSLIASCFDIKTTKKSIMLIAYFSGKKDCSGVHYVIRVPMEYPESFVIGELMQYVNSEDFAILKKDVLHSNITLNVDYKN